MSIRNKALAWYNKNHGKIDHPIYTSKYYQTNESWPQKSVWWPQIPIKAINENKVIHILCEARPGSSEFYHLKIPSRFLKENLKKFHSLKGKIVDFYFSTDPDRLFIEERGEGKLDFKIFL